MPAFELSATPSAIVGNVTDVLVAVGAEFDAAFADRLIPGSRLSVMQNTKIRLSVFFPIPVCFI